VVNIRFNLFHEKIIKNDEYGAPFVTSRDVARDMVTDQQQPPSMSLR